MRLDQFTVKAQEAIASAQTEAERHNHAEVTPEHLLAALLAQDGGVVESLLAKMGRDAGAIRGEMERVLAALPHVEGAATHLSGKLDAVFKSGNATRDTIPSHLLAPDQVPPELARFYAHLCPAGVYEATGAGLRVNPPNCVDCKATDVLGPRWTPREGGSGPRYRMM